MRNYFIFNGISSADYELWISGWETYNAPARDIENIVVPGRNGTLTIDHGRYENITVSYQAVVRKDFVPRLNDLKQKLTKDAGYHRLHDTYHPEYFRMAKYSGGLEADPSQKSIAGKFKLVFDCMPQRFLLSGRETFGPYTGNAALWNPSEQEAKPLLRIYGNGTVTITNSRGSMAITARNNSSYIDIDCDIMEAYTGTVNRNNNVILPDEIVLAAGENKLTLSGVEKIEITPRWWIL